MKAYLESGLAVLIVPIMELVKAIQRRLDRPGQK